MIDSILLILFYIHKKSRTFNFFMDLFLTNFALDSFFLFIVFTPNRPAISSLIIVSDF